MLDLFKDRLDLIVGRGVPYDWNGIPCFDLEHPRYSIPSRIRNRILGRPERLDHLRKKLASKPGCIILVNYANFALELEPCWRGLGVHVLIHCHGFDVHFDGREDEWPHQRIHDADYVSRLLALPPNHHFIANSEFTRDSMLSHGIPLERITVKYFGVEIPESPEWEVRVKRTDPSLLFLGRFIDCKGPELVIEGFERACDCGFRGTLVMAGTGPLLVMCELMAARSEYRDRIQFCGPVDRDEAQRLFADSDIFVNHHCRGELTLREEAFGVTMLEAMAHGLPVVTGRSGGVVESIIDGETGFLVEPGDIGAFASRLIELQDDSELRIRMGKGGRARVESTFTLTHERKQWDEIIANCTRRDRLSVRGGRLDGDGGMPEPCPPRVPGKSY